LFDAVFQLPYIPRPIIRQHGRESFVTDFVGSFGAFQFSFEEPRHQKRNVLPALAQRRDTQRQDRSYKEKVGAASTLVAEVGAAPLFSLLVFGIGLPGANVQGLLGGPSSFQDF